MKILWLKKDYRGSGSYHGTKKCEYFDCEKPARWFKMLIPDAFENHFPVIQGFCTKNHAKGGD